MKNFKKRKTGFVAILLAVCMAFTGSIAITGTTVNAATTISQFRDGNFTMKSTPELIYLNEGTDVVTFIAECEGTTADTVTCHITDRSHGGAFNSSFIFTADGEATLYEYAFPAGEYRIYFTGSSNIVKTSAVASFAKID